MSLTLVILGILALIVFMMIATYNRLVYLRQQSKEAWSAIETELRRRYDLIPNLVQVVREYAGHERGTLEEVIRARNSAVSNIESPESITKNEQVLTGALKQVFALSEAYPQLKANENFQQLQEQLSDTETRLSQARRFYNATVRELNMAIESFPSVLIAGPMGFSGRPYFGIDNPDAYEPVRIADLPGSIPSTGEGQTIKLKETQKELDS